MSSSKLNKKSKKLIIIAAVAVILIIFGVAVGRRLVTKHNQEKTISSLKETVTEILEDNSKIQETLDNGEDESHMEEIARDEYSYVNPEERVYIDSDEDAD